MKNSNRTSANSQSKGKKDDDQYVPKAISSEKRAKYIPQALTLPTSNIIEEDEYSPLPVGLDKPTPEYIPSDISEKSKHLLQEEEYVPQPAKVIPYGAGGSSTPKDTNKETLDPQSNQQLVVTHSIDKVIPGFYREQEGGDSSQGNKDANSGKDPSGSGSSKKNGARKLKTKVPGPGAASGGSKVLVYVPPPPTYEHIVNTLANYDIPEVVHPTAFCSNPTDVPPKSLEIGGKVLKLQTTMTSDLGDFEGRFQEDGLYNWRLLLNTLNSEVSAQVVHDPCMMKTQGSAKSAVLTPLRTPPSPADVTKWLKARKIIKTINEGKGDESDDDENDDDPSSSSRDKQRKSEDNVGSSSSDKGTSVKETTQSESSGEKTKSLSKKCVENVIFSTSTPQSQKFSGLKSLQLTPIGKTRTAEESAVVGKNPSAVSGQRSTKRRVSWENDVPLTTVATEPKRRRVSFEGMSDTDLGVQRLDRDGSQKKDKFGSLELVPEEIQEATDANMPPKQHQPEGSTLATTSETSGPGMKKGDHFQGGTQQSEKNKSPQMSEVRADPSLSDTEDFIDSSQPHVSLTPSVPSKIARQGSQLSSDSSLRRQLMDTQFRQQFLSFSEGPASLSQGIEGPTLNNTYGFRFSTQNLREAKALHEIHS